MVLPWLLGLSLGINIAGLALPLALVHVYDRILPAQGTGTALVLFSFVALAIAAEAFLRHVRGIALAHLAAREDRRLSREVATAALSGRLDEAGTGLAFALVGRARDGLGGGLAAALCDAPFALLFLLLVWMLAGPVVWAPVMVVAAFAGLALWLARDHAATGLAMLRATEAHQRLWRGLLRLPAPALAAAPPLAPLTATRRQAAQAAAQHEAAQAALTELAQVGALAIAVAVLAIGAPIALAGHLSVGGLGAATMLAGRGGGLAMALIAALLRHRLIRGARTG
jgi:ABC-type protease/lipase transport system fused ATPase/permease subunit